MIPEDLLRQHECNEVAAGKGQYLFHEGDEAICYFQIKTGKVMLVNYGPEGQEFIQGIFTVGQSFGEPPLVCDQVYPVSAITMEPTVVFKLRKEKLINLLKNNFEIHHRLTRILSERLIYKSIMSKEMANSTSENRIMHLVEHYRNLLNPLKGETTYIPLTRQQIAGLTGLRVETVIRTIKKLEEKGKLELESHKILI